MRTVHSTLLLLAPPQQAPAGGIQAPPPVYRILIRNPTIAHLLADVGRAYDAADPALLSGFRDNRHKGGTLAQAVAGSSTQQSMPRSTRGEAVELGHTAPPHAFTHSSLAHRQERRGVTDLVRYRAVAPGRGIKDLAGQQHGLPDSIG